VTNIIEDAESTSLSWLQLLSTSRPTLSVIGGRWLLFDQKMI
jgi:hypothetical protein